MARVIITESLFATIEKQFNNAEAHAVVDKLESLEENPHKGKKLTTIEGVLVKEVKYKKYRFYCITDGHQLKFGTVEEVARLLIKFVKMSEKKDQQQAIEQIKTTLRSLGFEAW